MANPVAPVAAKAAAEPVAAGAVAVIVSYFAARYIPELHLTPDQAAGVATLTLGLVSAFVRSHVKPTAKPSEPSRQS